MVGTIGLRVRADGSPIYRQICDQLLERIRSGALPAGYRLPPTRSLAQELNTHRNTVVRAFEELQSTGHVESVVGRGTFVCRVEASAPTAPAPRAALPWTSLLSGAAMSEPLTRLDRLRRAPGPGGAIDLAKMQPPIELLPAAQLRRCTEHVLRSMGGRALGYSPRAGVPRLREVIAHELARAQVPARAEDIIITTGSQQALDVLARSLIDPGDRFLVESSTYTGEINLLALAGARVEAPACDDEGPNLHALERLGRAGAKGLYLMPNCHNPTGGAISIDRREALIDWSHRWSVPLIEDDYGADLILDGTRATPALRALDADVIYVSTFSKKLIPALRVGFMVCPPAIVERLSAMKWAMDLGTSPLLQHTLAEFLERGYLRAHLAKSLPEYRKRRDALAEGLQDYLPPEVKWSLPTRGVTLWLDLPATIHPETAFLAAKRAGVVVLPSTLHRVDDSARGGLRLVFCSEPPARLREGAKRLGEVLQGLLKKPDTKVTPTMLDAI